MILLSNVASQFSGDFLNPLDEELRLLQSSNINFHDLSFTGKQKFQKNVGTTYIEKIMRAGFQFEEHKIITKDGYINTAWRIPAPLNHTNNNTNNSTFRKPVILQHGLLDDSYTFLALQPENCLAFILANLGYDVWLPNSRGNMFSSEHIDPAMDSSKFYSNYWNFSFYEMSVYDLPATVDYIKAKTGAPTIDYIGHSQGTFIYYLSFLKNPDYINQNIDKFVSIGTVVSIYNCDSRALQITNFLKIFDLMDLLHMGNVLQLGTNFGGLIHYICNKFTIICEAAIGSIIGTKITNRVDWHDIDGLYYYEPGGTSTKNLIHWIQIFRRQEVAMYDYGTSLNMKIYGQGTPPTYDLSLFKNYNTKSFIIMSDADPFSDEKDINLLLHAIPKERHDMITIKRVTNYNHLDYLWAECSKSDLYDDIVKFLLN